MADDAQGSSSPSPAPAPPARAPAAPPAHTPPPRATATPDPPPDGSAKETVISLIISLAMALVVKTYVVEAYRIPTGSMAPTLLGEHIRFQGPQTGYDWPVDVWYKLSRGPTASVAAPIQGDPARGHRPPAVSDPMTAAGPTPASGPNPASPPARPKRARAGDRILVQKYLYEIAEPQRYDVAVFKNPTGADQNYIKRLAGLPNEHLWIVEGDVFTLPVAVEADGEQAADVGLIGEAWRIQRKDVSTQRELWYPIFSSQYAPRNAARDGRRWWFGPWRPLDNDDNAATNWNLEGRSYVYTGADPTALTWDAARWPINDWTFYNDTNEIGPRLDGWLYPVGDVRVRAGVRPDQPGSAISMAIAVRLTEFRLTVGSGVATLEQRDLALGPEANNEPGPWRTLVTADAPDLSPNAVTDVELWHYDQSVHAVVGGEHVIDHAYDWAPDERLEAATGQPFRQLRYTAAGEIDFNTLANPGVYRNAEPRVTIGLTGGPASLHRVGLDRDIYYRPAAGRPTLVGFGCHPDRLATLGPDQFFPLGDNSAASLDGRGWPDFGGRSIDPWVADQIDPTVGIVPRKLLLGKAFFVYFPAPQRLEVFGLSLPIPDFGRMRLID